MALKTKIACNGIKPAKAEVYTLAAELVEVENIVVFKAAVLEALKSYDYYHYDDYYYHYDDYYYDDYDDYYYAYYYYDYDDYSKEEKIIALLFLAAKYS